MDLNEVGAFLKWYFKTSSFLRVKRFGEFDMAAYEEWVRLEKPGYTKTKSVPKQPEQLKQPKQYQSTYNVAKDQHKFLAYNTAAKNKGKPTLAPNQWVNVGRPLRPGEELDYTPPSYRPGGYSYEAKGAQGTTVDEFGAIWNYPTKGSVTLPDGRVTDLSWWRIQTNEVKAQVSGTNPYAPEAPIPKAQWEITDDYETNPGLYLRYLSKLIKADYEKQGITNKTIEEDPRWRQTIAQIQEGATPNQLQHFQDFYDVYLDDWKRTLERGGYYVPETDDTYLTYNGVPYNMGTLKEATPQEMQYYKDTSPTGKKNAELQRAYEIAVKNEADAEKALKFNQDFMHKQQVEAEEEAEAQRLGQSSSPKSMSEQLAQAAIMGAERQRSQMGAEWQQQQQQALTGFTSPRDWIKQWQVQGLQNPYTQEPPKVQQSTEKLEGIQRTRDLLAQAIMDVDRAEASAQAEQADWASLTNKQELTQQLSEVTRLARVEKAARETLKELEEEYQTEYQPWVEKQQAEVAKITGTPGLNLGQASIMGLPVGAGATEGTGQWPSGASRPSTPPTPYWLSQLTGLKEGQSISKVPVTTPSAQFLGKMSPPQLLGLAGYTDWSGGRAIEDILSQVSYPNRAEKTANWTPLIRRSRFA